MSAVPPLERDDGFYEHLLERLALALDEANTAERLSQQAPDELELRGLSAAEMRFLKAYLDRDRTQPNPAVPVLESHSASSRANNLRTLSRSRQLLRCAICGAAVPLSWGRRAPACSRCGSSVYRSSQ